MTSIIIPSRNEKYLDQTILDLQQKATGEIEIIVILDGWETPELTNVKYIYNKEAKGMRSAINQGVAMATGQYIMKSDAHCMFAPGYDEKLIAVHKDNWVQTPSRKRFDPVTWQLTELDKPDMNYMFGGKLLKGKKENEKNRDPELKKILIDDVEIFQGSCYFMTKEYYNKLGILDDKNFGTMGSEAIEIAFKVRKDGGRVLVNKTTWYAHAHLTRKYEGSMAERRKSRNYMETLVKL